VTTAVNMNLKALYIFLLLGLHFFILFGIGHAGGFLGLSVIFVSGLFDPGIFHDPLNEAILLPIIGLCTLVGYLCLTISIIINFKGRRILKIIGLISLWLSVIALLIGNQKGVIFSSIYFCIPFLLVSLYPIVKRSFGLFKNPGNSLK